MAEEEEKSKQRSTISLTHKQAALATAGIVSLSGVVANLSALKEFLIGDQSKQMQELKADQKEGFAEMKGLLKAHADDEYARLLRLRDITRQEQAASEVRCERDLDKVETRVGNLESFAFKTRPGSRSNNSQRGIP